MSFVYDGKMNYEEAKKVLGLGDSFTDDELKKVYRRLVKKYHPDPNANTEEENRDFSEHTKAINIAYKILKGKTKNSSQNKNNSTEDFSFSLEKYKKEKFNEFVFSVNCSVMDFRIKRFENDLRIFIGGTEIVIKKAKTVDEVNSLINRLYGEFDNLLMAQVEYFCFEHGIILQDINGIFNLELELKKRNPEKLYAKLEFALEKIKRVKIAETIQVYIGYAGYKDIESKVEAFKQSAINSNDKIADIVKDLKENIDKAFKNYFNNMSLINELSELTKSVTDKEILNELKELTDKVNNDDFPKLYDILKKKIIDIQLRESYNNLFNSINQKGSEALKNCKSMDNNIQIYAIFSKASELIDKIKASQIPITEELKNRLNLVTFENFKNDIDILDSLISFKKQIHNINNINNIYVKVRGFNALDRVSFFMERDGRLYRIFGDTYDAIVGKNENFIPLSQFLLESKIKDRFCVRDDSLFANEIIYQICTYKDGRSICLRVLGDVISEIKIYDSQKLISVSQSEIQKKQYQKYTDMEYLTEVISKQLNKVLDENLGQNSRVKVLRKK